MKLSRGIVSIPMVVGLIIMAIAIPVASKLALNNQDNRNRAAGAHPSNCTCVGGRYENEGGTCAFVDERCAMGTAVPTGPTKCVTDSSCGTNRRCVSGSCAVDKCIMDIECLNGRCSAGSCIYNVAPTSVFASIGASCGVDSDCASGACTGIFPNRKCTTGVSNIPNGQNCTLDSNCLSGLCTGVGSNRKCTAKGLTGSNCTYDFDCGSGLCSGVGANRKCVSKGSVGATCFFDNDCNSGNCSGNIDNRKCQPTKTVGSNCTNNSECASKFCVSFKCVAEVKGSCAIDANCGSGYHCSNTKCVPNKVNGDSCAYDSDCSSGYCSGIVGFKKCIAKPTAPPNGSSCIFDGDCASGHCIGNVPNRKCAESEYNRPIGADCINGAGVCSSGRCVNFKCAAPLNQKLGTSCESDLDCESHACISRKCQTGTPLATCISDQDCAGGKKCLGKISDVGGRSCR